MKKLILINILLALGFIGNAQQKDLTDLSDPYPGQVSPGDTFAKQEDITVLKGAYLGQKPPGVAPELILALPERYSLKELIVLDFKTPARGSNDIYWISAKNIEELRIN